MKQRLLSYLTPLCYRQLVLSSTQFKFGCLAAHKNSIQSCCTAGHKMEARNMNVVAGHEATETGLAYAPVSQAHGHNHIVQCFACCTAA